MNNQEKIKEQSNGINIGFTIAFVVIILLVTILTTLYFYQFNGGLSVNSGDWANLSSYLYGIPTMLLTALNVWLFYKLTSAANSLSAEGQKTSDGIISVFADKEDKRSKTSIGLQILDHYKEAQDLLLQSIKIIKNNETQYKNRFSKSSFCC